jgi:hypothetical protein
MNHCVNINSKEFRDLTKAANMNPVILAAKVSIWQEENGLDRFPKLSQLISENAINYVIDAAQILSSPEADIVFKKADKGKWPLDKVLTELQIPKTQKQIILQSGKTNRKDIVTDLLVNYSYAVEINTAKEKSSMTKEIKSVNGFSINGNIYDRTTDEDIFGVGDKEIFTKNNSEISEKEYRDALFEYNNRVETPTQHYSNLTVPGGTNYTENEIATPAITPSIKGHAQFATDNGIGWFRSDKRVIEQGDYIFDDIDTLSPEEFEIAKEDFKKRETTKTRRILEVQSDLFQKGRDKSNLAGFKSDLNQQEEDSYNRHLLETGQITQKEFDNPTIIGKDKENQFLQLLNKDNNWVTFFIKSIIQDSAKKGYEKVLFPTGNTASKIEGHTTLEEFKKEKENRIKVIEFNALTRAEKDGIKVKNKEEADKVKKEYLTEKDNIEIAQLKQELEGIEGPEGFAALKPIYNFYENTVFNILKKQGLINDQITDEHGNTWNEVVLGENKKQSISLTSKNFNNFVNEAYEDSIFSFLTKESDHIEYFNNCK